MPLTVQLTVSAGCACNQTRNPDKCPGIRPLSKNQKRMEKKAQKGWAGGRAKTRISRTVVYWYVELRNNLKVAALLQPLFGKVSSRNVVVSENDAPGPVGAYTTTHNDTITLMPNLIHRISFTELKFECRTRVAEGTSAGRSTLRHNRTHAPTGPRRARTYMRI